MSRLLGCARCGGEHEVTAGVELVGDHFLALDARSGSSAGQPLRPLVEFTPRAIVWRRLERPIADPEGDYTHWAPCPTNGQPVLMRQRGADRPEHHVPWEDRA